MIFSKPKRRKWLLIAGLMLAGFSLAFLVARAARNDLAAWTPTDNSGEIIAPIIEVDQ